MKRTTYKRPSNQKLAAAIIALRNHQITKAIRLLRGASTMKKPAASVPRPERKVA